MRSDDVEKLKHLNILEGVKQSTFEKIIVPSFLQSFPAGTCCSKKTVRRISFT